MGALAGFLGGYTTYLGAAGMIGKAIWQATSTPPDWSGAYVSLMAAISIFGLRRATATASVLNSQGQEVLAKALAVKPAVIAEQISQPNSLAAPAAPTETPVKAVK